MTPLEVCDDDADGLADFTLTDKDTEALNGQTGLSVSYYATESDAEAGTPEIGPVYTNVTADTQQVWIRLTDATTDCFNIMPLDLVVNPLPVPEPAVVDPLCDDDTDGLQTFDLSGVASQVIGAQLDMDVTYHQTQSNTVLMVCRHSPIAHSPSDTRLSIFAYLTFAYQDKSLPLEI